VVWTKGSSRVENKTTFGWDSISRARHHIFQTATLSSNICTRQILSGGMRYQLVGSVSTAWFKKHAVVGSPTPSTILLFSTLLRYCGGISSGIGWVITSWPGSKSGRNFFIVASKLSSTISWYQSKRGKGKAGREE